jgi:hypothetical protein
MKRAMQVRCFLRLHTTGFILIVYRGQRATWNRILARGNYGRLSGPVRCLHFLPRSLNSDVVYLRERHVSKE